ncbi:MAG TPA: PP2C family protein-serine/threonine phosphatase [Solirubrobacterales bacterium]|nr:PP2C family protein-serine/threonine phosphatase [Solirubrobacterales bacterium]
MLESMSNVARVAWIGASAGTVFVLWLLLSSTSSPGVAFFYAVPVGLAAWWFGLRAGLLATAACCGLYLIGSLIHPVPDFGWALAVRLVAFLGVAFLISLLRERLLVLEHSAEELEEIRAALTPATLPELPDVDTAAAFVPSEHGVSGDFYLLTNGPDGSTLAIVGDVVGHGPRAARLATFVRARLAALATGTSDPAELLTMTNDALVDRPGHAHDLVSAVCMRFRASDSQLCWAVAGHPLPLRLADMGELDSAGGTFLLGAEAGLVLDNAEAQLEPGDGVVIYTDGATDVRRAGALLGLDGLTRLLRPLAGLSARSFVGEVEKAILGWADGPIRDDLCLLVLKPKSTEK